MRNGTDPADQGAEGHPGERRPQPIILGLQVHRALGQRLDSIEAGECFQRGLQSRPHFPWIAGSHENQRPR